MKTPSRKNTLEWVVAKPEQGLSLQDFLALKMGVSKRIAKQQIDAKVVRVKGQTVWIARHALKVGDTVSVASFVKSPTALSKRLTALPILYEDDHFLVADKPRGLLVNHAEYSAENIVRTQLGLPHLVASHRLDRDTTGCLLMSKSAEAHDAVVGVFKRHHVIKTYRTVVYGRWDARSTTIELPIEGERALTHVHCLRANQDYSYLVVRIETGRTHQIRRHLAMARHPVVGDAEHGPKIVADERLKPLTYPLLHAVELELEHPYKPEGSLRVFSPIPKDFHRWLVALKLEAPRES